MRPAAPRASLTRTVVAGSCVNIHLGRFEHPDVYPAHTLNLAHYRVNFPLSAYLAGTGAIHAHPKYPRFNRESGSVYEFTRVEACFEGEEVVFDDKTTGRVRAPVSEIAKANLEIDVEEEFRLAEERERQKKRGGEGLEA